MTNMDALRPAEREAFDIVCSDTLSRGDPEFIHQHVVDAFTAQNASAATKPIAVAFSLIGLYLAVERNWTGKQVQHAHMRLAAARREWPDFELPPDRGSITVTDVAAAADRDTAIRRWCHSVWNAFSMNRDRVEKLLRDFEWG